MFSAAPFFGALIDSGRRGQAAMSRRTDLSDSCIQLDYVGIVHPFADQPM